MNRPAGTKTEPGKAVSLRGQLQQARDAIAGLVPAHLDADKVVRLAWLACYRDPKLRAADPVEIVEAVMRAASLGLVIGQTAHLLPFYVKAKQRYTVVLIPDYRGLVDLARRSGLVLDVEARAVFVGEKFEVEFGANPQLVHRPDWDGDRSYPHLVAVYAVAVLSNPHGQPVRRWEVMTRAEIEDIRARSQAKDSGPWKTDPIEMAKKTVVRRLCKLLPQSPELMAAIELDTRAETGHPDIVLPFDSEQALAATSATAEKQAALKERLGAGEKEASTEELEAALQKAREKGDDEAIERLSMMLEGRREGAS